MNLLSKLTSSPLLARVAPFVVFILVTFAQGYVGRTGPYWLYLAKTLLAAWMLWAVRGVVPEMKWVFSWEALVVGTAVFVLWVGLDPLLVQLGFPHSYPKPNLSGSGADWNPHATFGQGSAFAWLFIVVRLVGSACVVPPLEEVFYRSFFYRYVARVDFQSVPIGAWFWIPFLVTSVVFGFEHRHWLAGILCGFAYQGLVCWKKRLGDAIVAHGLTNLLLGLWVLQRRAWEYW
ncbi:MAG TPA: CAAX prenyl protease-related protein [Verrucomicrobiae bacterium]|nr:CAAX prenyl protease-related protein [Verrucomicrobiae bacterium]